MNLTSPAIVLPLLLFVGIAAAQDTELPQAISGDTIPCPIGLPAGEVEGETVVCGQIEVPQNWDEPDGTTIVSAYILNPDADLSLTCLEAMRPGFVLPDAELPAPPEPLAVSETAQSTGLNSARTDYGNCGG